MSTKTQPSSKAKNIHQSNTHLPASQQQQQQQQQQLGKGTTSSSTNTAGNSITSYSAVASAGVASTANNTPSNSQTTSSSSTSQLPSNSKTIKTSNSSSSTSNANGNGKKSSNRNTSNDANASSSSSSATGDDQFTLVQKGKGSKTNKTNTSSATGSSSSSSSNINNNNTNNNSSSNNNSNNSNNGNNNNGSSSNENNTTTSSTAQNIATYYVPSASVGKLIGFRGTHVTAMLKESGAQVISFGDDPVQLDNDDGIVHVAVTIKGSKSSREKAWEKIQERLQGNVSNASGSAEDSYEEEDAEAEEEHQQDDGENDEDFVGNNTNNNGTQSSNNAISKGLPPATGLPRPQSVSNSLPQSASNASNDISKQRDSDNNKKSGIPVSFASAVASNTQSKQQASSPAIGSADPNKLRVESKLNVPRSNSQEVSQGLPPPTSSSSVATPAAAPVSTTLQNNLSTQTVNSNPILPPPQYNSASVPRTNSQTNVLSQFPSGLQQPTIASNSNSNLIPLDVPNILSASSSIGSTSSLNQNIRFSDPLNRPLNPSNSSSSNSSSSNMSNSNNTATTIAPLQMLPMDMKQMPESDVPSISIDLVNGFRTSARLLSQALAGKLRPEFPPFLPVDIDDDSNIYEVISKYARTWFMQPPSPKQMQAGQNWVPLSNTSCESLRLQFTDGLSSLPYFQNLMPCVRTLQLQCLSLLETLEFDHGAARGTYTSLLGNSLELLISYGYGNNMFMNQVDNGMMSIALFPESAKQLEMLTVNGNWVHLESILGVSSLMPFMRGQAIAYAGKALYAASQNRVLIGTKRFAASRQRQSVLQPDQIPITIFFTIGMNANPVNNLSAGLGLLNLSGNVNPNTSQSMLNNNPSIPSQQPQPAIRYPSSSQPIPLGASHQGYLQSSSQSILSEITGPYNQRGNEWQQQQQQQPSPPPQQQQQQQIPSFQDQYSRDPLLGVQANGLSGLGSVIQNSSNNFIILVRALPPLQSRDYKCYVNESYTVAELKRLVQDQSGIPVNQQVIRSDNIIFNDPFSIGTYGLGQGSLVYVQLAQPSSSGFR